MSDDLAWIDDALCTQTDTEIFFPAAGESNTDAKCAAANDPKRLPARTGSSPWKICYEADRRNRGIPPEGLPQ